MPSPRFLVFNLLLLSCLAFFIFGMYDADSKVNIPESSTNIIANSNEYLNATINEFEIDLRYENNSQGVFLLPISDDGLQNDKVASSAEVTTSASAIYDVVSSQFIFTNNVDKRLPIASITKLMSAIVILENSYSSESINIKPEYLNVDGDGADLAAYESLSRDDLLSIMLIGSINDAALAFSGHLKLKNIDIVDKMNEKATEIGMMNTKFYDPAGLDDSGYSTARDLVKLVKYVNNYPLIWEKLRLPRFTAKSLDGKVLHTVINTNKLLGVVPEIVGGKTGFTDKSKGSLVLYLESNDKKIITVVIGSDDRFATTKQLLQKWNR